MFRFHLPFFPYVVWSALLLGLFGGFAIGAHLVFILAFGYPPGKSFAAMVQAHGHLQLLGWTGLFILGVSFYKLPRLMSTKVASGELTHFICLSVIMGLLLRSGAQIYFAYYRHQATLRAAVFLGTLLESLGILLYVAIMFSPLLKFSAKASALAAAAIKPFLLVSLFGWGTFAACNSLAGFCYLSDTSPLFESGWHAASTDVYIHLILIPTCLAFSLSTFPIFLKLRAPDWPVFAAASLYFFATIVFLFGTHTSLSVLQVSGACLKASVILWTVAELDLLRIRGPWFLKYRSSLERPNHHSRAYASDYGQFGNFEWLIYAAYLWLVFAAFTEAHSVLRGTPAPSTVRHLYLLGFVTHLIFGMAARMLPGFLGQNRIASPALVRLSFLLLSTSMIGRVFPQILTLINSQLGKYAYGLSGTTAMLALLCLGTNLFFSLAKKA